MKVFGQLTLSILSLLLLALAPIGAAWAQQVKVTSADPASTYQGTVSLDVIVTGSGFDSTAKATFLVAGTTDAGGITVRKTVVKGSKQLVATIDVADTAVVANFDIAVTLGDGRKGKGTTLFAVKLQSADPCASATPSFVFSSGAQPSLYLSNASATCLRKLFTYTYAYGHYNSFRVVPGAAGGQEGRVIAQDDQADLLLIRFPIGTDMRVDPTSVTVQRIFDPSQPGSIDVDFFQLAADGHRLAYVTTDEDGSGTSNLSRLRVLDDVDACVPQSGQPACAYSAGTLLAQRDLLSYYLGNPRWSTDEAWIYVNAHQGPGTKNYISRISTVPPPLGGPLNEPQVVITGTDPSVYELRRRPTSSGGSEELLVYGDLDSPGCRDVRVVTTASCDGSGTCSVRVNSTSPRVVVSYYWASLQDVSANSMTILADGGKVYGKTGGGCNATGVIMKAVESPATGVQITSLTGGSGPASK